MVVPTAVVLCNVLFYICQVSNGLKPVLAQKEADLPKHGPLNLFVTLIYPGPGDLECAPSSSSASNLKYGQGLQGEAPKFLYHPAMIVIKRGVRRNHIAANQKKKGLHLGDFTMLLNLNAAIQPDRMSSHACALGR